MLRYNLRYQLFLAASDALIVLLALIVGSLIRLNIDLGMEAAQTVFITPPLLYPVAPFLFVAAYIQAGVYTLQPQASWWATMRRLMPGHFFGTLLFLGALYLIFRDYSRLQAAYVVGLVLIGVAAHRLVFVLARARLWHYVNTPRNVIIVGTSANAQQIGQEVRANAPAGLHLVGFVAASASEPAPADGDALLGSIDALPALVQAHHIHEIVIAVRWFDQAASDLVSQVMRLMEAQPVNIRLAPDYSELAYFRASPEDFGGITLVGLRETVLTPVQRVVKRMMDLFIAGCALLVSLPVMLIIIIAVRLDSPGPAVFVQPRIGQHGRRFTIYKFRTMYIDADRIVPPEHAYTLDKNPHDPRVTRIGGFLRRTSLDELPQFLNVLRGEMSIVGPRPEVTWLARDYEWWQRKRFEVPQGLTGWWQVNGRSDKPMRYHIEDDLYYVRNYSIWLDLQIIGRTIGAIFSGRGAY